MLESRRTHRNLDSWRLGETFTFLAVDISGDNENFPSYLQILSVTIPVMKFQIEIGISCGLT